MGGPEPELHPGRTLHLEEGLGANPLRTLFRNNIITWTVCIFFTIQPSITLLTVGTFIWMFFIPFTEAIEQTILQKVVPPERLGRVFGFAHAIEQAASPITAFLIGPVAQFIFIPFMTTGDGVTSSATGSGRESAGASRSSSWPRVPWDWS